MARTHLEQEQSPAAPAVEMEAKTLLYMWSAHEERTG